MRQSITGLVMGLVAGAVLASGAAFALGVAAPGGSAAGTHPANVSQSAIVSQSSTRSAEVTPSVETSNVPGAAAGHEATPTQVRERVREQRHHAARQAPVSPAQHHDTTRGTVSAPMTAHHDSTAAIHHDGTCND